MAQSTESRPCVAVSWEEAAQQVHALAEQVRNSGFQPDAVLAVARGGLAPAAALCDELGVRHCVSVKIDHWTAPGQRNPEGAKVQHPLGSRLDGKKVLVVDDVVETGHTLKVAAEHARAQGATDVRTAVLYVVGEAANKPEYFAHRVEEAWVVFPWGRAEDVRQFVFEQLERSDRALPVKELQHLIVRAREFYAPAKEMEDALKELESRGIARSFPPKRWGGDVTWQKR
jgi:hypothetical protein